MRAEYVFALGFLGLAVFNSIRAVWFWRQKQRIMLGISLVLLVIALIAVAYMGVAGWRAEQSEAQGNTQQDAQVAP